LLAHGGLTTPGRQTKCFSMGDRWSACAWLVFRSLNSTGNNTPGRLRSGGPGCLATYVVTRRPAGPGLSRCQVVDSALILKFGSIFRRSPAPLAIQPKVCSQCWSGKLAAELRQRELTTLQQLAAEGLETMTKPQTPTTGAAQRGCWWGRRAGPATIFLWLFVRGEYAGL